MVRSAGTVHGGAWVWLFKRVRGQPLIDFASLPSSATEAAVTTCVPFSALSAMCPRSQKKSQTAAPAAPKKRRERSRLIPILRKTRLRWRRIPPFGGASRALVRRCRSAHSGTLTRYSGRCPDPLCGASHFCGNADGASAVEMRLQRGDQPPFEYPPALRGGVE